MTFYLDLELVSGGDIGQKPNGFFVDFLFGMIEQRREVRKRVVVKDDLSLLVSARHNVAHRSQWGRLHFDLVRWKRE